VVLLVRSLLVPKAWHLCRMLQRLRLVTQLLLPQRQQQQQLARSRVLSMLLLVCLRC
jgi:hypothetical protein